VAANLSSGLLWDAATNHIPDCEVSPCGLLQRSSVLPLLLWLVATALQYIEGRGGLQLVLATRGFLGAAPREAFPSLFHNAHGRCRLPYVAYDEAHRKNESPQANLLGFDSLGREKVDALCNAVEPQAYNRKGNGPTDNHECDVFGRAHFPVRITPWPIHSRGIPTFAALGITTKLAIGKVPAIGGQAFTWAIRIYQGLCSTVGWYQPV
jgi:hypothetical protein